MEIGFGIWYTAALLLIMSILLFMEVLEIEVVIFSTLLLLITGKVITLKEAFVGFSNEGMLTIALMYVVVGAFSNTGMLNQVTHVIFGKKNTGDSRKLLRLLFPVSFVSAFINNTPVVAMFIPVIRSWAEKHHYASSKYLIPLSYAAILGGTCTLIGTSTNLIVHGLMIDSGMKGISFFEISKVGVPLALLGILFISLLGHRLLPNRKDPLVELGEHTREFVIELKVTPEYENIGKTIESAGLRHLQGLFLFQIERRGQIIAPAEPNERILLGDRLFFTGIPKMILELQKLPGLQLIQDSHFDLKQYDSAVINTFEAVVSPGSPLVGKTVRESDFRAKYEAVIIAIHRHGERIQKKIGDISLWPGDTLLLLAGKNFRKRWYHSNDFYLIAEAETLPSKPQWRGYLSLGVFFLTILLTILEVLPLLSAAGLGVIILMATRTVRMAEARKAIDWRALIIIAMSLGVAAAIKESGLAELLASGIAGIGCHFGVIGVLTSIYIMTSFYTLFITNNAAAAMLFPIAISSASTIHADTRAFAFVVLFAASASFATPISYQTNLMVYGPGGYRFKDYLKIGVPLQCLIGIITMVLVYYFYF
ncbi:MAG: SLC13 family permease [Candidatus Brocadia sp. AMX2]|uniref:TrkA-C domain protein n=1 Tax=Candidatus Brocadia sinica JPN1 TaxID=1197129 RepID=A0ABQ0K0M5_9BACT|nr:MULTISPECIES: SLC13 family permease [Brocadia]KXK30436.1 MAG: putative Sulfur Deprivation Response Regulator [Candidatus Brocadia sinica]MBC6932726.1 SLC13 family permease [Candidatus Brocadia sp.]MBL1169948.1 SLC13 family permease [Candidatus Brocadia sp. AMX1]NOG42379.1 SLC13 family permease [Planctomycetota bacterium]KAA0243166.1 MAG: SLC13 family permease [Candidatus Brocadia sp. AMX2]